MMGLTNGFGTMADLLGPSKTNSGIGKESKKKLTFKDKAGLTIVVVHIWLIAMCIGLIAKVVNIFERRTKILEKELSNKKQKSTVIIDVEAKEVTDD